VHEPEGGHRAGPAEKLQALLPAARRRALSAEVVAALCTGQRPVQGTGGADALRNASGAGLSHASTRQDVVTEAGMLTRNRLDKLQGEDKLLAVVEAAGRKRRRLLSSERIERFSPRGQRNVALLYLLDNQVRRGGLSRFFRRSKGELNEEVMDALTYFGAHETRDLVLEAMKRFERHGEQLRPLLRSGERPVDISAEFCSFRDLDARYAELLEDVDGLVLDAIDEAPDDFVDPGLLERLFARRV
jgi:hypothetical protein